MTHTYGVGLFLVPLHVVWCKQLWERITSNGLEILSQEAFFLLLLDGHLIVRVSPSWCPLAALIILVFISLMSNTLNLQCPQDDKAPNEPRLMVLSYDQCWTQGYSTGLMVRLEYYTDSHDMNIKGK